MATKKQSTRSADSGWLLEIGVIGIDKTLKLVRQTHLSPLELELLLRPWSNTGLSVRDKMSSLPFRQIPKWNSQEHGEIADAYEDLMPGLEHDEELKKRKGGKSRKPLHAWRLNLNTFEIIKDNRGRQWKLFNRIKSESLILWDVIQVLRGDRKSMPKSYPDKITQGFYNQKNQEKVEQMIQESLSSSKGGKLRIEQQLKQAKDALRKHDKKRVDLVFQMALLSEKLKKWGKQSQK